MLFMLFVLFVLFMLVYAGPPTRRTNLKPPNMRKPKAASASATATPYAAPPELAGLSAVVINLRSRPDRWKRISRALAKRLSWLPFERLEAVDGKVHPPADSDVTRRWSTADIAAFCDWYYVKRLTMSPGERGCCASHIRCWQMCVRRRKPLIVLEDDAVLLPAFAETLARAMRELPRGRTDALWLCSKARGKPQRVGAPGTVLMAPEFVWTTVGYVLWPAGARKLLKLRPVNAPVDNFIAVHLRAGRLGGFSVRPGIVRQAQTWNVGSDVPHSDDAAHD